MLIFVTSHGFVGQLHPVVGYIHERKLNYLGTRIISAFVRCRSKNVPLLWSFLESFVHLQHVGVEIDGIGIFAEQRVLGEVATIEDVEEIAFVCLHQPSRSL